ncbi:MAG: ATP-dependent helicase, partial [Bacteroidota bacterium]
QIENYVHRVGRTGRGKNKGDAYSFCSKEEEQLLVKIQDFLGEKIRVLEIGKEEYRDTIDFSSDTAGDIKKLLEEIEEYEEASKKKFKKRKQ